MMASAETEMEDVVSGDAGSGVVPLPPEENSQSQILDDQISMEQDKIENELVYLMKRTAYLNIERNNLNNWTDRAIVLEIEQKNPERICPEFVSRKGKDLKLIFYSHEAREEALRNKIAINYTMCELSRPRQEARMNKKVLYFHGIPVTETEAGFKQWIAGRQGIKSVGEHRWLTWGPNSRVKTTSRSVEVEIEPGTEIPGYYVWYQSERVSRMPVRIWYGGIGEWCRYCEQKGHIVANCEMVKKDTEDNRQKKIIAQEEKDAQRVQEVREQQDADKKSLAEMLTKEYGNKTTYPLLWAGGHFFKLSSL